MDIRCSPLLMQVPLLIVLLFLNPPATSISSSRCAWVSFGPVSDALLGFRLGLHWSNPPKWIWETDVFPTLVLSLAAHQSPTDSSCWCLSTELQGKGVKRGRCPMKHLRTPSPVWRVWPRAGGGRGLILLSYHAKTKAVLPKRMSMRKCPASITEFLQLQQWGRRYVGRRGSACSVTPKLWTWLKCLQIRL